MPWHRVEIAENDLADMNATALMTDFSTVYKASVSLAPAPSADVRVYHAKTAGGGHTYYFSPEASDLAQELLQQWNAIACVSGF